MQSKSNPKKLDKIGDARLDLIPRLEDCKPGVRPTEFNVLVATVPATEDKKIGSIYIPDDSAETLDLAQQIGRIIDQSPHAYSYADWTGIEDLKPQIGQAVWFARYGGKDFEGRDGRQYRILKDKDVGMVIEEEPAAPDASEHHTPTGYTVADVVQHFSKTGT